MKKVLIIDDHPIISVAYQMALEQITKVNPNLVFDTSVVKNIDDAIKAINKSVENKEFDLIFLDILLPKSSDGSILSGEDLGVKIRKISPNTKIIVATTLNDNYRVFNILSNLDPDGFLVKSDITPDELLHGIQLVLSDPPYFSATVTKFLHKKAFNEYQLDKIDRQLLYELSKGTKMRDLPTILPMSMGGIEKRKRVLKDIFNISSKSDGELLKMAKEKGFI